MPDSPKCPFCLKEKEVRQTMKVAGRAAFKCLKCKRTIEASSFQSVDFAWRSMDEKSFRDYLFTKGCDIQDKKTK